MIFPNVTNVLKNGTVITDLTGHIVKKDDCPVVYSVLDEMNRHQKEGKKKND